MIKENYEGKPTYVIVGDDGLPVAIANATWCGPGVNDDDAMMLRNEISLPALAELTSPIIPATRPSTSTSPTESLDIVDVNVIDPFKAIGMSAKRSTLILSNFSDWLRLHFDIRVSRAIVAATGDFINEP